MSTISKHRDRLKDRVFMRVAEQLAALSTCDRKHVGAVIVKDGRAVSWGFNGAPPGQPHCSENNHGWAPKFKAKVEEMGCRNATHAEANALAFAAKQGISTEGATCFVTLSPCDTCSRLLVAAGIVRIAYSEEYRNGLGDIQGLEVVQIPA